MDAELSLTKKRWILKDASLADPSTLVEHLRKDRGIEDPRATTSPWWDPSVFPDCAKAAARVQKAVADGETIGIFGDYDCDGITASAQMLRYFRRRGKEPLMRLPHRVRDGYGLKSVHIDEFAQSQATLVISVDTGIVAHEAIDHARTHGIDVIVIDHHHFETPPNAFAVLHPDLAPTLPPPHPCAAGLVFFFLHALEEGPWEDRDIDLALATFGSVADVVSLRNRNRLLVRDGIAALARLKPGPIQALIEQVSREKSLTSTDIAFRIAPRINAAGRMAEPTLALQALLEGGPLLQELERLNALRQQETTLCYDDALQTIGTSPEASFLAVAKEKYPPGILGLIAGKLAERFGRPSLASHIDGEHCVASLRSPPGYNIVEGLRKASHLLTSFGGHAQAAGCSFALRDLDALQKTIDDDIKRTVPREHLLPALTIDARLPLANATIALCRELSRLEPYGQGNPEPLFLLEHIRLTGPRTVGTDAKHLQAMAGTCKVIGFGLGQYLDATSQPLDLVCRLGRDTWNGRESVQLFLQDLRPAETPDSRHQT